jgi:5-(hydroxymethyl)furfural/furfural oxidase
VVGAGSAGCVLGARLSEDERREVVVVESGPPLDPGAVPAEVAGSNFLATADLRDRNDTGLSARRVSAGEATLYRRGRGVGGSSVVNAMVALRGDPALYRSWGWDDVERTWDVVAVPEQLPGGDELGPVDLALLAADDDAQLARLTRRGRHRVTSAEAYLWPALGRPNLTVRSDAEVARVVIDDRRAVGVVLSSGEEIAAALVLRSGLDTPGIGLGLQDHPSVPLTLALRDGVSADPDGLVIGAVRQRDGVQFLPMNHLGADAPGFGLLLVALMTPCGRGGSVRVDPERPDTPVVDFALLDDATDLRALAAAVGDALTLLRTAPFADIVDEILIDGVGTTSAALTDTEAIERWLPSAVGDYVHASSSCAMGSVVDADGAVFGYRSLYVCDASVFPTIPDANTHLPTTMLAERLSARWRRSHP